MSKVTKPLVAPAPEPYRIAFIDVENSPNISYTWAPGKFQKNVIAFKEEWYLMAFSVVWSDTPNKVEGYALPDFPLYKSKPKSDKQLCGKLREVLDKADLVVTHNGIETDLPKARSRILLNGMTPPSPFKTVDTLKIARKQFFFNSNSLHDLAIMLNVPHKKLDTNGFDLWLGCMAGDPIAWAKMKRYNKRDSVVLREIYDKLRAWHPTHPNINVKDNPHSYKCPVCGSRNLQMRGWDYAQVTMRRMFSCNDCGKYARDHRRVAIPGNLLR